MKTNNKEKTPKHDVFSDNPKIEAANALIEVLKMRPGSSEGEPLNLAANQAVLDAAKDCKRRIENFIDQHNKDAPPRLAGYLLNVFGGENYVQPMVGDLDELYWRYYLPKYGRSKARFWYWKKTVCSIGGIAISKLKDLFEFWINLRRRLRS